MRPRRLAGILSCCALALVLGTHRADAWIHDQNQNRIDDRIEAVNLNGVAAAHVGGDLAKRLLIFVYPEATPLQYGVYVGYDHMPTDADVVNLGAIGAQLTWRPRYIPYLRARATFAQVQSLAALAGVTRVEGWQAMYPFNDNATRTLRVRPADGGVGVGMFPSVWRELGLTGRGVVVGILDSGVNDAASGASPGHQSLVGKFVGGSEFSNPDPLLNTPPDSSANPANNADPLGDYHATHVAGTAIGSGGPQGVLPLGGSPGPYAGMAPDARLVDCKVITDAGVGGGAAEALEWCIAHRNTVWGSDESGAMLKGVQVVNMSIGGVSASDGTDADCVAVNAAVKAGIVVCIATGNDGNTAYMPSPAAADMDIAVGSFEDSNTLPHGDDIVSSFSNEGPRTSDGDADHVDEMKPSVLGSGSDIISALGDPGTDGTRYHNINGTSMATPCITGLCALIRQANPGLTPAEVRDVLQNTAEHRTDHGKQAAGASDPFGVDPNYHPSWGWGEPDAVAAVKEALDPATTQVISESAVPALLGNQLQVQVKWTTQREVNTAYFDVYRAPDLGGYAGDFERVSNGVPPAGRPVIARGPNRTFYSYTDTDPSLVAGTPYWYQVRWNDLGGHLHQEPPFRVLTDTPPVRARVQWIITHSALDNDVFARFGSGTSIDAPAFVRPCGGSGAADSSVVAVPLPIEPQIRYFFHADLTDRDLVSGFLPPSAANPWFLSVLEEGFVDTKGAVDSFSVTVFNGPSATTYRALNPITPTVEKQTTTFWIPLDPATSVNHAPVFATVGDRTVGEGLTLNFQVSATDADGGTLTYSASGLPLGASFNPGTRTFDWTPGFTQAGSYPVSFRAADLLGAADTERVTITVFDRAPGSNTAPVLDAIADRTIALGSQMRFNATAHDAEGGALTFSAGPMPAGSTLDPSSGLFTWSPQFGDEGVYHVTFHVRDPQAAADSQLVTLTAVQTAPTGATSCTPDSSSLSGTIGVNVQGAQTVQNEHSFVVPAGVAEIRGGLSWTGGPAIDLDLYLVDPNGNVVAQGATASLDPEHLLYIGPAPGTYKWRVSSFDNPNPNEAYTVSQVLCMGQTLAVGDVDLTRSVQLSQNYPNPFARSSTIRFALPRAQQVSLRIYDIAGRTVRTLVNGRLDAGAHQRVWDGRGDSGQRVAAGVYFYRLDTEQGLRTRRMVMLQ